MRKINIIEKIDTSKVRSQSFMPVLESIDFELLIDYFSKVVKSRVTIEEFSYSPMGGGGGLYVYLNQVPRKDLGLFDFQLGECRFQNFVSSTINENSKEWTCNWGLRGFDKGPNPDTTAHFFKSKYNFETKQWMFKNKY